MATTAADALVQVANMADDLARLATAVENLNQNVVAHRVETTPVLEEYRAAEAARRATRARVDAEKLEGRGKVTEILTSKAAFAAYAAGASWLGAWLTGLLQTNG